MDIVSPFLHKKSYESVKKGETALLGFLREASQRGALELGFNGIPKDYLMREPIETPLTQCFSFWDKTERREMRVKLWERRQKAQAVLQGVVLKGRRGSTFHMAMFSSTGDLVCVI